MGIAVASPGIVNRAWRVGLRLAWRVRWGEERYGDFYRQMMDGLAERDPRSAVGGLWDRMGEFQLSLLRGQGMLPHHRMLDIGCGSLRGGLRFIDYLEPGNYVGVDLSSKLLEAGSQYVMAEGLGHKRPRLLQQTSGFEFLDLRGSTFDYVLAFGVFTDLPASQVTDCLGHVPALLLPEGKFIATYVAGDELYADPTRIHFRYPWPFFVALGERNGLDMTAITGVVHPKGHAILQARRRA